MDDLYKWQTGRATKDGLYVFQIHPYGSYVKDPIYHVYYIKNGVIKDYIDKDPVLVDSFWEEYAIKWMRISW